MYVTACSSQDKNRHGRIFIFMYMSYVISKPQEVKYMYCI